LTFSVAGAEAPWVASHERSCDRAVRSTQRVNGTINPDFSQVEADVGQVLLNERFALFYPEKRPFFLDGLELFDSPNQLIYTRQIVAPLGGVKLAGKLGGTNIASMVVADDRAYSGVEIIRHCSSLADPIRLRLQQHARRVLTAREDGGATRCVAAGDFRFYPRSFISRSSGCQLVD
jgi:hypothetical protein